MGKQGFASMPLEENRRIASLGGKVKVKKGIGTLSPEKRREFARSGGLAVQASGNAYRFTSETARAAVRMRKDR